jgi:hypothetical protein
VRSLSSFPARRSVGIRTLEQKFLEQVRFRHSFEELCIGFSAAFERESVTVGKCCSKETGEVKMPAEGIDDKLVIAAS